MPEEVESIAVIEVGDGTSLLATLEEEIGRDLRKLGGGLKWEVESGLADIAMRRTGPNQPVNISSQAVFFLLKGPEEEIARSRGVVENLAKRHRRNARFLIPGDGEFEGRRRTTFGKLGQGAI